MKKNKIYYVAGGGRLANQIMTLIHFQAFLLSHPDNQFVNIKAWPYFRFFQNETVLSGIGQHNLFEKIIYKIFMYCLFKHRKLWVICDFTVRNIFCLLGGFFPGYQMVDTEPTVNHEAIVKNTIDTDFLTLDEKANALFSQKKKTVLLGYNVRNWALVEKNLDQLRSLLILKDKYTKRPIEFVKEIREKYDVVIGIAMRQTDYKVFADGRYYFTSDQYVDWINKIEAHYKDQKVAFVLTSDEKQDPNKFNENVFFAPGHPGFGGHYLEDLASLGLCDVITGPPSTFSFYAYFMADIGYIPIRDQYTLENEVEFKQLKAMDVIKDKDLSEVIK